MSNEKQIQSYGAAAGILAALVSGFLLNGIPASSCAKVFVESIEEQKQMPEDIINLKNKVKEKYNL